MIANREAIRKALCDAFCGELYIAEVPVGLAVRSAFHREDGDAVTFYIVHDEGTMNKDCVRLEDDGDTVPYLDSIGVDLTEGARAEAFSALLKEYNAKFDNEQMVLHTDYMSIDRIPSAAMRFTALLLRMQDFALITRSRVEDTFRGDVMNSIRKHFENRAEIKEGYAFPKMKDTPVDVAILAPDALPLAVFIGTSENRALESIVFWLQARMHAEDCKVIIVLESYKPQRIKERTLARIANSFQIAVYGGMEEMAMESLERNIYGSEAVH